MESLIEQNKGQLDYTNDKTAMDVIKNLNPSELPKIINEQVEELNELGEKVEKAKTAAENALKKAEESSNLSAGFGHKKEAIEGLQDAALDLATSQGAQAEAIDATFENQKKLSDITKYLFALGVYSVANTRIVIQQLADELEKGGKKKTLSDVARKQLQNVITQLQAQQKIMEQQESFDSKLDEHEFLIEENAEKLTEHDSDISALQRQDIMHDVALSEQMKKDAEHDRKLGEIEALDKKQEEKIKSNADTIAWHSVALDTQINTVAEHDRKLTENETLDKEQEEKIQANADALARHSATLTEQQDKDNEHDRKLGEIENLDKVQEEKIQANADALAQHSATLTEQQDKDIEHDRILGEIENLDKVQEEKIQANADALAQHSATLTEQQDKDIEHDRILGEIENLDKVQEEKIQANADALAQHSTTLTEHHAIITDLLQKNNELHIKLNEIDSTDDFQRIEIEEIKHDLEVYKNQVQAQFDELSEMVNLKAEELVQLVDTFNAENKRTVDELTDKIDSIENKLKKNGWKIAVSVAAGASLLLNLLQILKIL